MYRDSRTLDERCSESKIMRQRYPDRVPVIIEPKCKRTPIIDKRKYMAPINLSFAQLFYVVRKRLQIGPEQGLFFFMDNNTIARANASVSDVYNEHANEDGFLYVKYSLENTFG